MGKRRASTKRNGGVGYRRPPKATQFKKGASGNPRGRPKGSKNISKVFLDVTAQKIPVTENGQTRRMPALEIMLRRLANDAMQSDPGALKLFLSLMERYADITENPITSDRAEILTEDQEILGRYFGQASQGTSASSNDSDERTDQGGS